VREAPEGDPEAQKILEILLGRLDGTALLASAAGNIVNAGIITGGAV
jgi:hypothetical protein